MASDKKCATKTNCQNLSKEKKEVGPAISHIVDAIKTIVHCSKDEDFRRRCFATFQVEDLNGFSQTLTTELRTIARRRFGSFSDSLPEKELNAYNNMDMEKENCNFDDLKLFEEGSLYEVSTTSQGKMSPMDSQSTSTNVTHVTLGDCEMATENQDLFEIPSDIDWNTSESKNYKSGENEAMNLTVKKGSTVNQPVIIGQQQLLKDSNVRSKQTSFEMPMKNSEITQDCETQISKCNLYHLSKLDTEREDSWSNDLSWDNLGANTKSNYSLAKGRLHSSNSYHTNDVKANEWLSDYELSCYNVTDEHPTMSSQNSHIKEIVKQRGEEEQCVPVAGNSTTSATQHSSPNTLDDFELLAGIF